MKGLISKAGGQKKGGSEGATSLLTSCWICSGVSSA